MATTVIFNFEKKKNILKKCIPGILAPPGRADQEGPMRSSRTRTGLCPSTELRPGLETGDGPGPIIVASIIYFPNGLFLRTGSS